MTAPLSFPRLVAAMIAAGVVAAFALAVALHFLSQSDGSLTLPTVPQLLGMSAFFCFFTLPVAAVFALPVGWLWQRFGPLRLSSCAALGAACGVVGGYGFLLLTFVPTLRWGSALWFAAGGAAAGLAVGWVMRGDCRAAAA